MSPAADVVILGAGVVGSACAEALAREGRRVTVVEPHGISAGVTGAAMGHIVVLDDCPAQFALTRYSRDLRNELAAELPPQAEFERCGTLWPAATEQELAGLRYLRDCRPIAAEGGEVVKAVILRRGDRTWRVPCHYLACGFGLVPNLELPLLCGCALHNGFVLVDDWQRTTASGIYAAGEITGVGGAEAALVEGMIAGYAAAGDLDSARRGFATRRRAHRFQAALATAFALRPELRSLPELETIVCRCEDVPFGSLRAHPGWRSAKLMTRCGMGPCQGRVCGPALQFILGWEQASVRPPLFPGARGPVVRGGAAGVAWLMDPPCNL